MHAHQLILKTALTDIHHCQKMLQYAAAAASGAALRQELANQSPKLDALEAKLLQIVSRRGWELCQTESIIPSRSIRRLRSGRLCDSSVAEILIRGYQDALIRSLKLLHSLPYPDAPIRTAVDTNRDCLLGCVYRLLVYL